MCFFTSDVYNSHNLWSCQKVCDVYLLDNVFIRFGTKIYSQTIDIPMETNCVKVTGSRYLPSQYNEVKHYARFSGCRSYI